MSQRHKKRINPFLIVEGLLSVLIMALDESLDNKGGQGFVELMNGD